MIDKGLRIERTASAGIVITKDELSRAIAVTKNDTMSSYEDEVPVWLDSVAERAQIVGRMACGRDTCQLSCAGTDLTDHETPKTNVDGDLTARCPVAECSDEGVRAAVVYFQDAIR